MYNITELVVAIGEWSKALLVKEKKDPRFAPARPGHSIERSPS